MTAAGELPVLPAAQNDNVPGTPAERSVLRLLPPWRAVTFEEITGDGSPQRQQLWPAVCWGERLSAGWVVMPPGHMAAPHVHHEHDLVAKMVAGWAETLIWHPAGGEILAVQHGPGDMILIPAGWAHVAVNLSRTRPAVAAESRTDPAFNADVELLPDVEPAVHALARRHQRGWRQPKDAPYSVVERLLA
jgi:uncharacterized RmlC-like cupin family protein